MRNRQLYKNESDEELAVEYQDGDAFAFTEIYSRYERKIFFYFLKKTSSREKSFDLLQDAFLKFHNSRHLYNPQLKLAPWIFTISKSVWIDDFKKAQNQNEITTESQFFEKVSAQFQENTAAASLDLESDLFLSLNEKEKTLLKLRYESDLSFEEISEKLDESQVSLRKKISRLLAKLKFKQKRSTV